VQVASLASFFNWLRTPSAWVTHASSCAGANVFDSARQRKRSVLRTQRFQVLTFAGAGIGSCDRLLAGSWSPNAYQNSTWSTTVLYFPIVSLLRERRISKTKNILFWCGRQTDKKGASQTFPPDLKAGAFRPFAIISISVTRCGCQQSLGLASLFL